jgi:hypothetical protein
MHIPAPPDAGQHPRRRLLTPDRVLIVAPAAK